LNANKIDLLYLFIKKRTFIYFIEFNFCSIFLNSMTIIEI